MTNANNRQPPAQSLLDVREVAEMLGCSARHVDRMVRRGAMPPPLRLGHLRRWPSCELEQWMAGGCRPVELSRKN